MSVHKRKPHVPTYRLHKQRGQAVVTLTDGYGGRRDVLLGKHGTKDSKTEYQRVVLEWKANERRLPQCHDPTDLSAAELIDRYWKHIESYYRRADGTETQEVPCMRYALRPFQYLMGKVVAKDFGPSSLKAVRTLMIDGYEHPKYGQQEPLCRIEINKRVKRVRRMFKWAIENELVTGGVLPALQAVSPLKRGRTDARDSPGVKPVARAVVEETLPILCPTLKDMVMLQLETGMRPGEMVTMRAGEIDMSGKTWLYRPAQHKSLHHGHERTIAIGPSGQPIVKRRLSVDLAAPLFSPRVTMQERFEARRAKRQPRVQPSQADRMKRKPKRQVGNEYTNLAYARAIADAIKRHNEGKPDGERLSHWAPNQLRHLRALELKRQFGLDVARAVLGHRQPCITEMCAGADVAAATKAINRDFPVDSIVVRK